jgi:hypothetical protein
MKILYINNDGAGFADFIEVPHGTTVATLFANQLPHGKPQDYLIRVNRLPVASNYTLMEGERVSITPVKIQGAVQI